MHPSTITRSLACGAFAAIVLASAPATQAASPVENYALAISWEPAYCISHGSYPECSSETPTRQDNKTFSLHGLWPQNESYCGVSSANKKLDENGDWSQLPAVVLNASTEAALQVAQPGTMSYLDRHEWIEHGTCSGLSQQNYYTRCSRCSTASTPATSARPSAPTSAAT
jgi:ribonuclease T2